VTQLVIGLGNPGPEYERTRHNVGFRVVERIARDEGLIFQSASELEGYEGPADFDYARTARSPLAHGRDALLVKPRTFMNLSGVVVAPLVGWLALLPGQVLVVTDDFDLPLGTLRIRPHGGPGTHNGMRSIVNHLATDRFPRLRIGIGAAGTDAARHVLEEFAVLERAAIETAVEEAALAIRFWLETGDIEACMTRFHSRWNQGA